ncbi:hypothetical protein Y032_0111g213 [Ancylostoma ceylanicum]|uniref:Uncharacterized protein n=1 Tax=Ancylostoma ceylanicum TaxID=53326 RepID=A0A016TE38_9BILA|nr:hypothetical protein Y032_0111g213 [Ancylostoma ceylanicum]
MPAVDIDSLLDEKEAVEPFNNILTAIRTLDRKLDSTNRTLDIVRQSCDLIIERTTPAPPAFCPLELNRDEHTSRRCHQYPDVAARAMRVAALLLCEKCLKPSHETRCEASCSICSRDHNSLLCPNRTPSAPFRKRKM